jgi:Asp-tRNA(Asn)/Glu-tRNA(Gln) amidotransferase A subunit family amidase
MTVRDIASAVAAGELTPDDVIEATLSRIGELEPLVQAFSLLDAGGAREQARVLTAEAKAGKLRGPARRAGRDQGRVPHQGYADGDARSR